jgi:hypothetical protein
VSPEVAAALEAVALRLDAAGVEFLLGGSGLLHALGAPVDVHDVDLVVRPESLDAVRAAAGAWWRSVSEEPTELFRSPWKATLDVGGVEVELIGGLAWVAADGTVATMPFRAAGTWSCRSADVRLAPPEAWLALYRRYKPERAEQLAALLEGRGAGSRRQAP